MLVLLVPKPLPLACAMPKSVCANGFRYEYVTENGKKAWIIHVLNHLPTTFRNVTFVPGGVVLLSTAFYRILSFLRNYSKRSTDFIDSKSPQSLIKGRPPSCPARDRSDDLDVRSTAIVPNTQRV